MKHVATVYLYNVGSTKPNLIRYFWDQTGITLLQQKEYLIQGIRCPGDAVLIDPDTEVWNLEEALEKFVGTSQRGAHYRDDGKFVVVY